MSSCHTASRIGVGDGSIIVPHQTANTGNPFYRTRSITAHDVAYSIIGTHKAANHISDTCHVARRITLVNGTVVIVPHQTTDIPIPCHFTRRITLVNRTVVIVPHQTTDTVTSVYVAHTSFYVARSIAVADSTGIAPSETADIVIPFYVACSIAACDGAVIVPHKAASIIIFPHHAASSVAVGCGAIIISNQTADQAFTGDVNINNPEVFDSTQRVDPPQVSDHADLTIHRLIDCQAGKLESSSFKFCRIENRYPELCTCQVDIVHQPELVRIRVVNETEDVLDVSFDSKIFADAADLVIAINEYKIFPDIESPGRFTISGTQPVVKESAINSVRGNFGNKSSCLAITNLY